MVEEHNLGGPQDLTPTANPDGMNWRGYVTRHPAVSLGVAMAGGLLVSRMFRRKETPTQRMTRLLTRSAEGLADSFKGSLLRSSKKRMAPGFVRKAAGWAATALVGQLFKTRFSDRVEPHDPSRIDVESRQTPVHSPIYPERQR